MEKWLIVSKDFGGGKPSEDAEILSGYALLYPEVSDEEFMGAALLACRTLEPPYFPKPAKFTELLYGSPETRGELAWAKVREAVRSIGQNGSLFASDLGGDGAAVWAVSQLGWPELCAAEAKDMNFRRTEFLRLYTAAFASRMSLDHVAGRAEILNATVAVSALTPGLCGRASEVPELRDRAKALGRGEAPALTSGRPVDDEEADFPPELLEEVRVMIYGSLEAAEKRITERIEETKPEKIGERVEIPNISKRVQSLREIAQARRMPE